MRQCLAYEASLALPRCEVVTCDLSGVAWLAAKNLCDDFRGATDESPTYFNNPPWLTTFVNRGRPPLRIESPTRLRARATRPAVDRWWFRGAVMGDECVDIGWQCVGSQSGGATIRSGLKCGEECDRFCLTTLMRERMHIPPDLVVESVSHSLISSRREDLQVE
jgi:hypothetical protein